jgi:hypothetical protein
MDELKTFCENTCKPFQKKYVKLMRNEAIDEFEERVLELLDNGYTMLELAEQIREIASEMREKR